MIKVEFSYYSEPVTVKDLNNMIHGEYYKDLMVYRLSDGAILHPMNDGRFYDYDRKKEYRCIMATEYTEWGSPTGAVVLGFIGI